MSKLTSDKIKQIMSCQRSVADRNAIETFEKEQQNQTTKDQTILDQAIDQAEGQLLSILSRVGLAITSDSAGVFLYGYSTTKDNEVRVAVQVVEHLVGLLKGAGVNYRFNKNKEPGVINKETVVYSGILFLLLDEGLVWDSEGKEPPGRPTEQDFAD